MQITASMVKELREKTGAGMMDCKKALQETNGDIEKAIDYLREKGMAQAQKKQGRIAAEGLCNVVQNGNEAVIYELNSETDFVAKNEKFINLINEVGEIIINSKANNTDEALAAEKNGKTIDTILADATSTIGEKISLRRVSRVVKAAEEGFGIYLHQGGRIAVLTVLAKADDVVAKDLAMHIAAQNPRFIDRSEIDEETIAHETQILRQQALNEGKPENIVDKMVVGRLNKYLQDICLVDQPYVKDPDQKVSQYLKTNNNSVKSFIRLNVGEGIEKREEDFAAEVAAQLKK